MGLNGTFKPRLKYSILISILCFLKAGKSAASQCVFRNYSGKCVFFWEENIADSAKAKLSRDKGVVESKIQEVI